MPPKIFSPFSRIEKQGKLRVHFRFQAGNLWTNLAEIWPTYCQVVFFFFQKTVSENFDFFLVFELEYFFHTYNKRTNALDKNLRHGFLVKHVKKQMRSQ